MKLIPAGLSLFFSEWPFWGSNDIMSQQWHKWFVSALQIDPDLLSVFAIMHFSSFNLCQPLAGSPMGAPVSNTRSSLDSGRHRGPVSCDPYRCGDVMFWRLRPVEDDSECVPGEVMKQSMCEGSSRVAPWAALAARLTVFLLSWHHLTLSPRSAAGVCDRALIGVNKWIKKVDVRALSRFPFCLRWFITVG